MKKVASLISFSIFLLTLSACSTPPHYGTGIMFDKFAVNPEPEKSALVYVYRNDGWGYGGKAKSAILADVIYEDGQKIPIAIFQDKMYRPYLFEPKKVKFSSPVAFGEEMILKAGETRCVEVGWHFRMLDMVTVNETPLNDCLES